MPTLREWVIELVVMVAAGVALAALGPFGSFVIGGFGARLAYWVPAALIGYAIFRPITLAALLIARRLDLPELGAAIVGTLLAAVPASFAIAYFGGYRPGAEPSFEILFQLYIQVGVIGVLVMTFFMLINRDAPIATAIATPAVTLATTGTPPIAPPFLDRLPPAWADRLIALEMEDHYVRAHGPDTSALILLRMRDAEAELAGIDGLRIHRSWWVVRSAVEQAVRDGRGYKLRLTNGLEPPVARDRVAALKAAGWLG
ncbi:MAG: LytTR family DNA-binding domain-containing protein [Pseudomonadota bacterium]